MADVEHAPHRVILLLAALTRDLAGTPFDALRVLQDLTDDGKLDHPPGVLRETMACLLGFASLATTVHLLSDLIRPENRSVRLALVVYARSNGIPLEDSDLDVLRDHVLNTDQPDPRACLDRSRRSISRQRQATAARGDAAADGRRQHA